MSKYMFEFDSEDKSLTCYVDGLPKPAPKEVVFYEDYEEEGEYSMNLTILDSSEDKNVRMVTHISASELSEIISNVDF